MIKGKVILSVKDHADSAFTTSRLLQLSGHDVTVAATCAEALRLAAKKSFELYLIDIGLPDGDGCELLPKLLLLRSAPALVITGFGMPHDIDRAAAAGFTNYLIKPFTFDQLNPAVERAMV